MDSESNREMKESKSRRKKLGPISDGSKDRSESSKSGGVQLSITEFYRSTKVKMQQANPAEGLAENSENGRERISKARRKLSSPNLPKSVRRRLLFD